MATSCHTLISVTREFDDWRKEEDLKVRNRLFQNELDELNFQLQQTRIKLEEVSCMVPDLEFDRGIDVVRASSLILSSDFPLPEPAEPVPYEKPKKKIVEAESEFDASAFKIPSIPTPLVSDLMSRYSTEDAELTNKMEELKSTASFRINDRNASLTQSSSSLFEMIKNERVSTLNGSSATKFLGNDVDEEDRLSSVELADPPAETENVPTVTRRKKSSGFFRRVTAFSGSKTGSKIGASTTDMKSGKRRTIISKLTQKFW